MAGFLVGSQVTKADNSQEDIEALVTGDEIKTPSGSSAVIIKTITTVGDPIDKITITPSAGSAIVCHPEQRIMINGGYTKARDILIGSPLGEANSNIHVAQLEIAKDISETYYSFETDQQGAGGYLVEAHKVFEPQVEFAY